MNNIIIESSDIIYIKYYIILVKYFTDMLLCYEFNIYTKNNYITS